MFNNILFHSQNRLTLPKSKGFGRLYNWYAASSRSYGMLYNWYAATDVRNIAPVGWHVPNSNEFLTLIYNTGGGSLSGKHLCISGSTYFGPANIGDDLYGFSALGAGSRGGINGTFSAFLSLTIFISTTTSDTLSDYPTINVGSPNFYINSFTSKSTGGSIRLIKDDSTDIGTMTGNDGKKYATVKIGNQVWMSENLEETKFRNGDTIPVVTDNTAWAALTTAGSCWYNNTRTYNLAPVGWRLLNDNDYYTLMTYLGGSGIAGGKLKEVGTEHWNTPNTGATNEFGFSMLGAGWRQGTFTELKYAGYLYRDRNRINTNYSNPYASTSSVNNALYLGLSVRFIRNINSVLTTNPVDSEGNSYETVTIGTQTWTKQNHKSKKWRTGESINVQDIYTDVQWAALTVPACCAYNNDENNV